MGRWAPLAAAILGSAAFAAPAGAALSNGDNLLQVGMNTADILVGPSEASDFTVERDGVLIATGTSAGPAGAGESGLNSAHFPGESGCWDSFIPQILPGDVVTNVTQGDSTVAKNLSASPFTVENGVVVVRGSAADENGNAIPADELDIQIHAPEGQNFSEGASGNTFFSTAAANQGGGGSVDYNTTTKQFVATFNSISPGDLALAQNGETVVAWVSADPAIVNGGEEVDYAAGATPAAVSPCTEPYRPNAVTGGSSPQINKSATTGGYTVTGVNDPNVTAVSVTLGGQNAPATVSGTTWSASFSAGQVSSMPEGAVTASAQYTNADGAFHGESKAFSKDSVAPNGVAASVAPGTYPSTQNVALSVNEGTIRYTTDGSDPTAGSPAYSGPIGVARSQSIKAVAIDAAGNTGPVSQFDYTISAPAATPLPLPKVTVLPKLSLERVTMTRRMRLRTARRSGISAIVFAPTGAKVARIRILRGKKVIQTLSRKVSRDGVLELRLPSTRRARRALRRGLYTIQFQVGQNSTNLGKRTVRRVRLR